jgi:hypothetical protein
VHGGRNLVPPKGSRPRVTHPIRAQQRHSSPVFVPRQIDPALSVAVAAYCGFATPVPLHAGQVVTWVSLSRGRFGNKPSRVSSHDICPPPWQMGHGRISSSAIQRSGVFMQKDSALQTKAIICETIVAHFIFTASPQNPQLGLKSAHGQSREHRFWTAVSGEWTCQEQARKGIRARRRDIDRYAEQICYPQHAPPGSRASPSRSRFSSAATADCSAITISLVAAR